MVSLSSLFSACTQIAAPCKSRVTKIVGRGEGNTCAWLHCTPGESFGFEWGVSDQRGEVKDQRLALLLLRIVRVPGNAASRSVSFSASRARDF